MAFRSALCMLALAPAAADEFLHPRRASDCSEAAFCCWWPQNQDPANCGQCGTEWGNRKYLPGTSCPASDGRPFETGERSECQGVGTWCEGGAAPPVPTPAPTMGPDAGCGKPYCCWWGSCGSCGTAWNNRMYLPGSSCPTPAGDRNYNEQSDAQDSCPSGRWCTAW